MSSKKTEPIFVALSGGVDSAVVARLLMDEYETVIGISHRHWPESRCCSTDCLDRCAAQCADMGIPYYSVDCMVEFTEAIVEDFVETYERGQTPNPCVRCNQTIRFDLMMSKFFEEHPDLYHPDYKIATGHYVRVEEREGHFQLMRGIDPDKDQSYMLYRLSSEQLSHCVFPLGHYMKADVRKLAEQWNLKSAKVQDSMDVCFVNDTYKTFLDEYTGHAQKAGNLVTISGEILGSHEGVAYYTRGQRKGLGLSGGPWYVVDTNVKTGDVTLGRNEDLLLKSCLLNDTRWVNPRNLDGKDVGVQLRYHSKLHEATLIQRSNDTYVLQLKEPCIDICPGQSAVIYDGDDVVGGGVIAYDNAS